MKNITIPRPDDWHLHLRDGEMLKTTAPLSSDFGRAIIMPNLVPPIVNVDMAREYRDRIIAAGFASPLMTMYLTESTTTADIDAAIDSGIVHAVKLYPAGATTNSASGVQNIDNVMPVLEQMTARDLPLCVHGEVTDPAIDIFDREAVFIERVLSQLRSRLPELRVIMEHVTTKDGIDYVLSQDHNLGATITTHHLIIDRNDLLVGGVKPHFYCLPIVKRRLHRDALRKAATSGDSRFFLGTDSAPHSKDKKECECCAAGVFSAPNTMPWLAQVFHDEGKLENLAKFASQNGPAYYGLPVNAETMTLERQDAPVTFPKSYGEGDTLVTLFDPGKPLLWKVV